MPRDTSMFGSEHPELSTYADVSRTMLAEYISLRTGGHRHSHDFKGKVQPVREIAAVGIAVLQC